MKYHALLAALAALQPLVSAVPASIAAGGVSGSNSGDDRESSSGVSVDTEATPDQAKGQVNGSFTGDSGELALKIQLDASRTVQQVVDGAKEAGLPQELINQLSEAAQKQGDVNDAEGMANLVGTLGKVAADATADNNATQVTSVLASIKGVVKAAMGDNTASNVLIGAGVAASVAGEKLKVIIKVTKNTIRALEQAAKSQPKVGGELAESPRDGFIDLDAAAVQTNATQDCETDICKASIDSVINLASKGINHDVIATFVVSVEALGKFKSVDVQVQAEEFAKEAAQGIEQLGSDINGNEAAQAIGNITQHLQLSPEIAQEVTSEAESAAREVQKLNGLETPSPSTSARASATNMVFSGRPTKEKVIQDCMSQEGINGDCVQELFHLQGTLGRFQMNCWEKGGDLQGGTRTVNAYYYRGKFPEGPKCGKSEYGFVAISEQDYLPICDRCIPKP
ncbi:hypothetical protein CDD83_2116 [Cordyceps sp. RAO-2017]|nr:hypothetical protein CDD83_2116 [Cordyceps sp. RAO-2017]